MMASLDHAMWFHRPFRADEWFLYDQASPSAAGARGLARGSIFRADGTLAVSVMQEGLVRPVEPVKRVLLVVGLALVLLGACSSDDPDGPRSETWGRPARHPGLSVHKRGWWSSR